MSVIAFFRQSSWLTVSTLLGGLCSAGLHTIAPRLIDKADYGILTTSLELLKILSIPVLALQVTLAQLAAKCITPEDEAQLSGTVRWITKLMVVGFAALLLLSFILQQPVTRWFNFPTPAVVWFTLASALVFWTSQVLTGLLQGRQDFFWLGMTKILYDLGRFVGAAITLWFVSKTALGAIGGVFWGAALALTAILVARWRPLTLTTHHATLPKFPPQFWLLTLALGAMQILMSSDMLVVNRFLDKETASGYGAARVVGFHLIFLTAPLTLVMFPKIVRSAARVEHSDILAHTFFATLFVGTMAALACTIVPKLPLRILSGTQYLNYSPLVVRFVWALLPLAVSNVLINNLLARERFTVVILLMALACAYPVILHYYHPNPEQIIALMAAANLCLLLATGWLSWRTQSNAAAALRAADSSSLPQS